MTCRTLVKTSMRSTYGHSSGHSPDSNHGRLQARHNSCRIMASPFDAAGLPAGAACLRTRARTLTRASPRDRASGPRHIAAPGCRRPRVRVLGVRIVQMSDLHVGTALFRADLLSAAVVEAN